MAIKVHIIEDEKKLNTMICDYLKARDYDVVSSYDGVGAMKTYREEKPDIVILDFMLPGLDGIDILRKIRETDDTPVIMLTARAEESDKLMGLDTGADDYMTKPFSMKELAARIRALLRRSVKGLEGAGSRAGEVIVHGGLTMDESKRLVEKEGRELKLTSVQFDILKLFLQNPGRVFTRLELLEAFQDVGYEGYERTIDVHIKNIRKEVEDDPSHPVHIVTVWGVGYKWAER
jgi:two-component system OmpR family response regulator